MYPFGYKIFQEWHKNYSSVYKESIFVGFQFLKNGRNSVYGGFSGWGISWCKPFSILSTFDPNGPHSQNWYFLAYFGIVPLEVEKYVLPMVEHILV